MRGAPGRVKADEASEIKEISQEADSDVGSTSSSLFCPAGAGSSHHHAGHGGGQARAAKVRSPEMLADGRITFRLLEPKATEVLVQGNWKGGRGLAMAKDDSGLRSVTTPVLQPEVWVAWPKLPRS